MYKRQLLTNATGAYGLTISEHLLGMLLMLYKKLYSYRDAQMEPHWTDAGRVKTVVGSTVLILGAGNIGTEFALSLIHIYSAFNRLALK